MANNPTMVEHAANLLNALNFYHRNGQYPLDDTSLWNTLADFQAYLTEAGSYRYPGQLVSITNGEAYGGGSKDVSLAVVRPDGTAQMIGSELIFDSVTAAESYITANPEFAAAGKTLTVKKDTTYELYVIKTDKTLQRISFEASDIPEVSWDALTGKPTSSVTDIDAAVTMTKRFTESDGVLSFDGAALAKVTDIPTQYEASKITGVINISNLPSGALERMYIAANDTARLALTTAEVQNGDTVKVTETGKMYYVKDDSKLGTGEAAQAFEEYTAGAATSVPWSGVTGTPTTLSGYGITDGVNSADVQQTYTADGKVVAWKQGTDDNTNTYNIEGKAKQAALADVATIARNAEKLGGQLPDYYATSANLTALSGRVDTAESDIDALETKTTQHDTDIVNLKNGSSITALAASKLTGEVPMANLPDAVKGHLETVADDTARFQLTTTQVQTGDVVKVTETGTMYFVKDDTQLGNEGGYEPITASSAGSVEWDNIKNKPTTVAGSGLTDALADGDVSTTYGVGKVVGWVTGTNDETSTNYEINGKAKEACKADKAGDASTLGGNAPSHFATEADLTALEGTVTGLDGRMDTAESDIDTIQGQIGTAGSSGILKEIADLKTGSSITALDASKITGEISIDNLPKAAIERLYIADTATALSTLTTNEVQNGDTVKVADSGLMYFVKDDTKLGTGDYMNAFEAYTVGQASQVPWSGVTGKPSTLSGYGITDAVASKEKVTEASAGNAGKILVLNSQGKLDVDITGHVEWNNILNKPTSSVTSIDNAVTAATHTNRAVLDKLSDSSGKLAYDGKVLAVQSDLDTTNATVAQHTTQIAQLGLGALTLVDDVTTDLPSAQTGQMALEIIA